MASLEELQSYISVFCQNYSTETNEEYATRTLDTINEKWNIAQKLTLASIETLTGNGDGTLNDRNIVYYYNADRDVWYVIPKSLDIGFQYISWPIDVINLFYSSVSTSLALQSPYYRSELESILISTAQDVNTGSLASMLNVHMNKLEIYEQDFGFDAVDEQSYDDQLEYIQNVDYIITEVTSQLSDLSLAPMSYESRYDLFNRFCN